MLGSGFARTDVTSNVGPARYILDDDGNPVPCPDLITWANWFEQASVPRDDGQCDRHVAVSLRGELGKETMISTVFLGLDHSLTPGAPPLLFETMIFRPDSTADDYQERYTTREEALAGHKVTVALVETLIEANSQI